MTRTIISIVFTIVATAVTGFAQQQEGATRPQDPTVDRGKGQRGQDKGQRDQRNQGKKGNKKFREMDKNGDGYIQETEWTGNKKGFPRFDLNKDGQISLEEFNQARTQNGGNADRGGKGNPR